MISVTKLLLESDYYGDNLRYNNGVRETVHGTAAGSGPVVVWNSTRSCNLRCIHCYMDSEPGNYAGELTTSEAKSFIDGLAAFKVPVLLISGGEPLVRKDLFELVDYAKSRNMRVTVSTNGTLIDAGMARRLKKAGVGYVGISLDGIGANNDRFRRKEGAFEDALRGIRNCLEVGQRVGLRFTINRHNYAEIDSIFDLAEAENVPRICFYHLVYSGRGSNMISEDITHEESRQAMRLIIERTLDFGLRGKEKEVLMVDNHADGPFIYEYMKERDPERAARILELLRANGGNRTGIAIGAVDSLGYVYADQFTRNHAFGNVRERPFGEIWTNMSQPILSGLKNRKPLLKGRCSSCRWLDICNGNFRARAEAATGDFWESDPACYLTDEEIRCTSGN